MYVRIHRNLPYYFSTFIYTRLFLDKFFLKGQKNGGAGLRTEHTEDNRMRKGNQVS